MEFSIGTWPTRALFWKAAACLLLLSAQRTANARVKLITLPVRERVEIQLDNAHATLVEEERVVPLVKGTNQVDFSWANTQIDPDTIVFRVIGPDSDAQLDVEVLSVSYPPNESALVWNVQASESGSARVRISYLLGDLSKSFNYRAVASHDEKTLDISEYMRLQNDSTESFAESGVWAGFGAKFQKHIGLYETKEMLVEKFSGVPIHKTYTCGVQEHGYLDQAQGKLRVPMHYVLTNDAAHKLGLAALPSGKVRIFIEGSGTNSAAATAFLGEDWGDFTPKDDEMRLYLGVAQDVVVKRTIEKSESKHITGNLYNRDVIVKYEIENFKKQPVTLDVTENLRALRAEVYQARDREVHWEMGSGTTFEGGPDSEHSDVEKLIFHAKLPAADSTGKSEKIVHKLNLIIKSEW